MKKNNLLIIAFAFVLMISSCSNEKSDEVELKSSKALAQFNWLIGKWEEKTDTSLMAEYWNLESDSLMRGVAMYILKGDTNFFETITIEARNGEIYYTPIVAGQNVGESVPFKLTIAQDTSFVFEDPKHDFPQKVVYEFHLPDNLYAYIEGVDEGVFSRQEYFYKRVK